MYIGIQYIGNAYSLMIDLYAGSPIRLRQNEIYEFTSSDLTCKEAIDYYKSLEASGLLLVKGESKDVCVTKKEDNNKKVNEVKEVVEEVKTEEVVEEEVVVEEVKEVEAKKEFSDDELAKFLEDNYNDSKLRALSKSFNIKPTGKKKEVIQKLVDECKDQVIALIEDNK